MTDATKYTAKLRGSRVLIFGGTSGIGYGVAEACLESGATVILSSSKQERIDSAISSLLKSYPSAKSRLSGYACDLSDGKTVDENIKAVFDKVGEVNHVINSAGDSIKTTPLAESTVESLQQIGMVRFFGAMLITKHAASHMPKNASSSITFTSGSAAEKPIPGWGIISAYSMGLYGLTKGMAFDMRPIRVNCVSPGAVETPLWNEMPKETMEHMKKQFVEKMLTGAMGKTEDVAEAYLYLLKDENCSGIVIGTNGGSTLM